MIKGLFKLSLAIIFLSLGGLGWWLWWSKVPVPERWAQAKPTPVAQATPTPLPSQPKARLAIVIDDWGYQAEAVRHLRDGLKFPITTAILPGLPYSRAAAEASHAAGHCVILHLPMESVLSVKKEEGTLLAGMDPKSARLVLGRHWASVPFLEGLNNHEGSKASGDRALMNVVAAFLKEKDAFFLDSVTSPRSAIPAASKAAGIPWAKRRVFLDNVDDEEEIKAQLATAVRIAKKTGTCIAIGHPRIWTLKVLEAEAPGMAAQGVELVPVSALMARKP